MTISKPSPKLKGFLRAAENDAEIIPVLHEYLASGKLPNPYTISVRGGTGDRRPDGWFHPSSHPLLTERQLYFYLTDPDFWLPEPFGYTITMSAMIGSVVHDIVETALIDLKYLIKPKGVCQACGFDQPRNCREHGAADRKTKSRGHMDGVLGIGGILRGFEFKTAMPRAIQEIQNNDVEAFRKKWPYYYAQVQEYMRMTGMTSFKVIFWAMGNPWDMREFTIEADIFFQRETEVKYLAARQAVEEGVMPLACCNPGSALSKSCPARSCPVKAL